MKKKSYFRLLYLSIIFAVLTIIDQITKIVISANLKGKEKIIIIPKLLSFEYLENNGAAWGIFPGKTILLSIFTFIFTLIIFIVIFIIEKNILLLNIKKKIFIFIQFLLAILTAGAVGNLIDRIRYGYVVDFLQFEFIKFPIFNLADCYVTVSAVVLVVILLFFLKDEDFEKIMAKKKVR